METKIFILKLKRFGRGGVNGEFSVGNSSIGILEFSASLQGSKAEGAISFKIPSKIPSLGSKATEARNSRFLS